MLWVAGSGLETHHPFEMLEHPGFWPLTIPRRSKKSECLHMTETSTILFELAIFFKIGIGLSASLASVQIRRCGFVEMSSNDDCHSVLQSIKYRHILTFYRQHQYIALKVYIHSSKVNREIKVLEHLSHIKTDHPGRASVRTMLDNFEATGPKGAYQCVVHEPLLTSALHFQAGLDPPSLPKDLLKGLLQQVLLALDYLHTEANVMSYWSVPPGTYNTPFAISNRNRTMEGSGKDTQHHPGGCRSIP